MFFMKRFKTYLTMKHMKIMLEFWALSFFKIIHFYCMIISNVSLSNTMYVYLEASLTVFSSAYSHRIADPVSFEKRYARHIVESIAKWYFSMPLVQKNKVRSSE